MGCAATLRLSVKSVTAIMLFYWWMKLMEDTCILEQRAVPTEKDFVPLKDAAGRVCASSIIPYPPGIPIVCPGEVIDEDVIEYIRERREAGEKVIGLTAEGTICVGRQKQNTAMSK